MTCSVHVLWFHTPWVKSSNPFLLDIWSHVREKKLWNLYRKTCVFSRFFTFRFIGNQKFSAIKTSNPSIYRIFGRMHVHEKNLSNLYIEGRELGLLPPDWEQEFESCCTMHVKSLPKVWRICFLRIFWFPLIRTLSRWANKKENLLKHYYTYITDLANCFS